MATISDRLLKHGVRLAEKVWGRALKNLRTGITTFGEFEEVEPIVLVTDGGGEDPREGSFFWFQRPVPDIQPGDRLEDGANIWTVLQGWENHPYKPRAKVKVQLKSDKDS